MRPIDADALIEKCGDWYVEEGTESGFIGTLKNLLATEPTIQPQSTAGQLNDGARSTDLIDRQQVIDALKRFKPEIIPYEKARRYVEETIDTMYNRIEALPTIQPVATDTNVGDNSEIPNSSDCISRQQAVDALDCLVTEVDENGDELFRKDEAYHVIEVLPPIQHETHEGRFERKQDGVFCSVCHYGWEFITGVPAEVEREYHYCPNCGAKMKGAEHETN